MTDERELLRQQMLQPLLTELSSTGVSDSVIPGVRLFRCNAPTSATPTIYEPTLCLLLQGSKQLLLGDELLLYNQLQYLLVPVMLPVSGKIIKASNAEPYIGMSINLDLQELTDLVIDLGDKVPRQPTPARGISVGDADPALLSVFQRILQLIRQPQDIAVLLPLLKRELLYRLLLGPVGGHLREFTLLDSQANRISKVIELLRQRYNQPLRIKELADVAHLSESALFQSFKAVTSMSPLQFQKQLRLNEARRIMLYEGLEAATASYKVGYESPSQFSREYSRLFGAPPKADVARFRQTL
ncbi:transcriptional regulator, AraC family [Arsukibacterium tuosuense]|uniref:Transcriptional regulator, AraC family n=1 Tax=Arsukibacterium tuosuense TaxID=1323745 RepID=A0A285IX29_9GAMM|nr:AraC family transcriptional regulator [Arsukibacterium tuosuense]SNY52237.1 transcriptional regulator, AraC family [Arsukibacterium tuosuense]